MDAEALIGALKDVDGRYLTNRAFDLYKKAMAARLQYVGLLEGFDPELMNAMASALSRAESGLQNVIRDLTTAGIYLETIYTILENEPPEFIESEANITD